MQQLLTAKVFTTHTSTNFTAAVVSLVNKDNSLKGFTVSIIFYKARQGEPGDKKRKGVKEIQYSIHIVI